MSKISERVAAEVPTRANILFISSHHGVGASESLWLETALNLAERGLATVTAGVCWAARYPERSAPLTKAGVAVHWLNSASLVRRLQKKLLHRQDYEVKALRRLTAGSTKPQLVVISQGNDHSALPWIEACNRLGLKSAVVTHGIVPSDWPDDRLAPRLREAFLSLAGSFWVSARNLADFEIQIGSRLPHAQVVWNPIKVPLTSDVPWPARSDVWRMACVARLQTRPKGHDLLLQALALPHWRERNLQLSFFGTGPNRQGLERLANMLSISDRVQFRGHVDGVADIWREHHLLAQPSRHEGMPLSLVEALICGRPAFVTDVAGHAELIQDEVNGFVAEAPTVRHLDAALQRAWDRRGDWEAIGRLAGAMVRKQIPTDPVQTFTDILLSTAAPQS